MKLTSKIKLALPFLEIRKTLTYNSFEKASWDVYFITSIFNNASTEIEAKIYITELVADGSLKDYFFSIFDEVRAMNQETISRILDSSLYPIVKVNKDYSIKSFATLNLSILEKNGRPFKILSNNYDLEQEMKEFLNDDETFVKVTTDLESELSTSDSYEVLIEDNKILVKVLDNWYELKITDFKSALINKCENINYFLGVPTTNPEGKEWKILDTEILNSFLTKIGFYDEKNWYILESEYWQELTVAKVYEDIYFYQIKKIMFSENQLLVEKTLEYLVTNQKYDEIRTKTLLALFSQTDNHDLVQKIINDLLNKKDSKEISSYALKLLMQGLRINWSERALIKMKTHSETIKQWQELYRINENLFNFEDDRDIIFNLPEDILSDEHRNEINQYKKNWKKIKEAINRIIGEMTSSGVREDLKDLPSNSDIKGVKKTLNKVIGHNKTRYHLMNLEKLQEEYKKLSNFYQNEFLKVKRMIDENKKNKKINKIVLDKGN